MQDTLARKLRVLRAERGLTLRQAERLTGVDKDTLSKIERGLRNPYDVTLSKLAKGYDVPVDELLQEPAPLNDAPETGLADTTEGPAPLGGWIGRALSEGDFALEFERAKASQELADELHRAKHTEAIERQKVVATLEKHHAPPAEILEARRDRAVANAQLTAAAILAAERWRGHDVSGMDPKDIVDDVIHTQSEYLVGERADGEPYPEQAGESA